MTYPFARLFGRLLRVDPSATAAPWAVQLWNRDTMAWEDIAQGDWRDGEMRWQGAFRPDGNYYVGDVVRTGAGLYVCTERPIPVQQTKSDTFTRANQDGWGTASGGDVWVYAGTVLVPTQTKVVSNQGLSGTDASGNFESLVLGAPLASANAELLVRWSVAVSTGANDGVSLSISSSLVYAFVTIDGHYYLRLGGASTSGPTWAGVAAGTLVWTRLRQDRGEMRVRTWQDGSTEPSTWDAVWDSGVNDAAGDTVGLQNVANNASTAVTFDHFTVSMLRRELPSPSVDPGHWDFLAS